MTDGLSPEGPDPDGPALTHVDEHGKAHMVDVTAKPVTLRRAVARCVVSTSATAALDPWQATSARLAGIQAAKKTSSLVPLCHPLPLGDVDVEVAVESGRVRIQGVTQTVARTGVEMEALCACTIAALSVMTTLLPLDPNVRIEALTLWHKSGGRSGTFQRDEHPGEPDPGELDRRALDRREPDRGVPAAPATLPT